MDSGTVTLIFGLSTVLASGITSSVVTYRLNQNKDQTIFLREKAEQLYLAADEFGKDFSSHIVSYFPLLEGRIDYNQMLDMHIEQGSRDSRNGGVETMIMLAEIYFPSVRPALESVWRARSSFNDLTREIKETWIEQGSVSHGNLLSRFQAASLTLDRSIESLKDEIVAAARVHAGVKQ
jgi:hypothetical protein